MRRQMRWISVAVLLAGGLTAACRSDEQSPAAQPASEAMSEGYVPPEAQAPAYDDPDVPTLTAAPPPSPGEAPPAAPAQTQAGRGSPSVAPAPVPDAAAPSPSVAPAPTEPAVQESLNSQRDTRTAASLARPVERLIDVPRGTRLPLVMTTTVASDTSAVEDRVTARVASDVVVQGTTVIPEGSQLVGRVTHAEQSGRVKGLAALTVRFYSLTVGDRTYEITPEPLRWQADSTKGKDAQKIGIGAGAGAVVGGLLGGRKGAAVGAAAGGAGGTGVVLATRGEEIEIASGTRVTTSLAEPVAITVR